MDAAKVEISPGKMLSHAAFDRESKAMGHVKAFQDTFYEEKNMFQVQVELEILLLELEDNRSDKIQTFAEEAQDALCILLLC